MQDIIKLLPDSLANQIAAGEVVQRPASVVKELLENAIDAGSTDITLILKEAGKSLIQVVDNGCGMSETDARMAFERHATSKISRVEDLFAIHTFGFRGEALASIAAVAQVELRTRRASDELGTCVRMEGGDIRGQEPVAMSAGTSLLVRNLFYNIPARRNFLKSNPVEFKHVLEEFQRVALAHPETGLALYHNEEEIYSLKGGTLAKRIISLLGKNYQPHLVSCQEEVPHCRVSGFVGRPDLAKKTRGEQFFFANGRFVRHNALHHAVMTAFEGLLPEDSYPFYVLRIEVPAQAIDVNVHPTKTEVKFEDERTVYAVVRTAVQQALAQQGVVSAIDFQYDVNFALPQGLGAPTAPAPEAEPPVERITLPSRAFNPPKSDSPKSDYRQETTGYTRPFRPDEQRQRHNLQHWEQLYGPPPARPETVAAPAGQYQDKPVMQLHERFILCQVKSGLMVIDQQAAQERVLYERFLGQYGQPAPQQLVFPAEIPMNPVDFSLLMGMRDEMQALGFVFGGENGTLVLQAVPTGIGGDEKALLEAFVEQIKHEQDQLSHDRPRQIARLLAERAAARQRRQLLPREMHQLIDQLFATSNPYQAPGGQKTLTMLDLPTMEAWFAPNGIE